MNESDHDEINVISIRQEHKPYVEKIIDDLAQLRKENDGKSFIEFSEKSTKLFAHKGIIKGFCNVHFIGGIPYLDVFVFKEYRGQGLGPLVTKKLKQQLFDQGYGAVGLIIHKDNKTALKSAEKSGFYMIPDNEEFNPENKEDIYYTYIARNYNLKQGR
ncbi:MAG TPA: GNAT family N-acetyltransferase [Bacilli bacterium]|nr:GNAT family N-acetyltransferase [Bacilli bacterium]